MARRVSGPYVSGRLTNKQQGSAIGGATITVNKTVYTDDEMQNATTTLVTNGTGDFSFYALPGLYTFTTAVRDAAPIEPIEILGNEGLGTDRTGSGAYAAPADPASGGTYNTLGQLTAITIGAFAYTAITYNSSGLVTGYTLNGVAHTVTRDASLRVTAVS